MTRLFLPLLLCVSLGLFCGSRDSNITMSYEEIQTKPEADIIPSPEYPDSARKDAIEGRTVVKVLIDVDGSVAQVEIDTSSGYAALDSAALDAAKNAKFKPAMHEGKRVKVWSEIVYSFRLTEKPQ